MYSEFAQRLRANSVGPVGVAVEAPGRDGAVRVADVGPAAPGDAARRGSDATLLAARRSHPKLRSHRAPSPPPRSESPAATAAVRPSPGQRSPPGWIRDRHGHGDRQIRRRVAASTPSPLPSSSSRAGPQRPIGDSLRVLAIGPDTCRRLPGAAPVQQPGHCGAVRRRGGVPRIRQASPIRPPVGEVGYRAGDAQTPPGNATVGSGAVGNEMCDPGARFRERRTAAVGVPSRPDSLRERLDRRAAAHQVAVAEGRRYAA